MQQKINKYLKFNFDLEKQRLSYSIYYIYNYTYIIYIHYIVSCC